MLKLVQKYLNKLTDGDSISQQSNTEDSALKEENVGFNIDDNLSTIKQLYSIPENSDVKIHEFIIPSYQKRAVLLFISSITDDKTISNHILGPLLRNDKTEKSLKEILESRQLFELTTFKEIVNAVNQGNTVLFIDEEVKAYEMDTSNFQSRSVEKAENEIVIKGPKEAFTEKAETNISLIRKKIRSENLIVETTTISKRSNNNLYLLYIKDLANEKLVKNVKERVSSLNVDAIQNLSLLEQYIEERPLSIFPSVLCTERPDRAVSFLEDGFIALVMNNSPDALILPASFWSFIHNPEDHYLRFIHGNFIRIIRVMALFITLFGSAIYVSITNYHAEMVPTDLLLAIAATREIVPFPSIFEIILMELAFELIREAGLRVPNTIGPTMGIVGALILGQAAVQANIVSPIVVIVVALSGLCSFTISDTSMNYTIRIIRFSFILAAGLFGIFGMTALFTLGLSYMVSIKSFGVPYMAPMSPGYSSSGNTFTRRLLKNERIRPGFVKPKDSIKKRRN